MTKSHNTILAEGQNFDILWEIKSPTDRVDFLGHVKHVKDKNRWLETFKVRKSML